MLDIKQADRVFLHYVAESKTGEDEAPRIYWHVLWLFRTKRIALCGCYTYGCSNRAATDGLFRACLVEVDPSEALSMETPTFTLNAGMRGRITSSRTRGS